MPSRRLALTLTAAAFLVAAAPAHAAAELVTSGDLDFGDVPVATQSATLVVTVTNVGDEDADLGSPNFTSGTGRFGLDTSVPDACNTKLFVRQSCQLGIFAIPDRVNPFSGSVHLPYTSKTNSGTNTNASLSGQGTDTPLVTIAATPWAFGEQPLNTIGGAQVLTATLHGPATLTAKTSGANRNDFLITQDDCTGHFRFGDQTCDVGVRFAPSAQGLRTAALTIDADPINDEDLDNPFVSLTNDMTGTGGSLPQGPKGDPGTNGVDGATGPVGPQGPEGDRGANGANGAPGATGGQGPAGANGAAGPQGPIGPVGPIGLSAASTTARSATLALRTARIRGGWVALRLRCPSGSAVSTGTLTLRTTTKLHGARRTLGTAAFTCPAGQIRTVHVAVRPGIARLVRRHRGAVLSAAFMVTRNAAGASVAARSALRVR